MQATVRSLVIAAFAVFVVTPATPLRADENGDSVKNCYSVRGEARYAALGYNHVVIVTNRCEATLQCEVWSNVDPTPRLALTVGPNATEEKTTRINSPARGFKAFAECKK